MMIKSYIETTIESAFHKDEGGNCVYYPWGPFFRGRIISSPKKEQIIVLSRISLWSAVFTPVFVVIVAFILLLSQSMLSVLFWFVWLYAMAILLIQAYLLRGCQYSKTRRWSIREYQRLVAQKQDIRLLRIFVTLFSLCWFTSVFFLSLSPIVAEFYYELVGVPYTPPLCFSILIFSFMTWWTLRVLRFKREWLKGEV